MDYDPFPPEPEPLSGEQALARYNIMRAALDSGEATSPKCFLGETVLFFPADKGYGPGHIYSETGKVEFRISRFCEFHFDEMMPDEDDEDDEGE